VLRVLIVEDWFLVAEEVERMVHRLGHEVVARAPDLESAVRLAREETLDAAVLDVNLEGRLVFPAADLLAERGVPFVFASGYDASVVPERYRHVPRVSKPFTVEQLAAALASVCGLDGDGTRPDGG